MMRGWSIRSTFALKTFLSLVLLGSLDYKEGRILQNSVPLHRHISYEAQRTAAHESK